MKIEEDIAHRLCWVLLRQKRKRCNTSIDIGALLPVLPPKPFYYNKHSAVGWTVCECERWLVYSVSQAILKAEINIR